MKKSVIKDRFWIYVSLQFLVMIYSLSSVLAKVAAQYEFLSCYFIICYIGIIMVLGIYAIGWQQIIKKIPLTVAYISKAVEIVWGIFWGITIFNEHITAQQYLGAGIVMLGVFLYFMNERN